MVSQKLVLTDEATLAACMREQVEAALEAAVPLIVNSINTKAFLTNQELSELTGCVYSGGMRPPILV